MKIVQLLSFQGTSQRQVCRDTDCLCLRSHGPESSFEPVVAGDQKASLASLAPIPPVQALRGLPCLGSFSVVLCIRHIEGPPRLGPYSVDRHVRQLKVMLGGVLLCSQRVRHLLGQPLCCSTAHAGMWGVRGYRDGSTHYA